MMTQLRPFNALGPTVNIAVGMAATTRTLTRTGIGTQTVRLLNFGTDIIYFKLLKPGDTDATTADTPLLPNHVEMFLLPNDITSISVISAATGNVIFATTGESA